MPYGLSVDSFLQCRRTNCSDRKSQVSIRKIDRLPHYAILPRMLFQITSRMMVIGWLALLLCGWTAGDRVIDLAFEEPDVAADTQATAEEPDNAAEHVLMPSQRVGSSAPDMLPVAPDLDAFSIAIQLTDHAALGAASPHYPPPRNTPVSFLVPLRI